MNYAHLAKKFSFDDSFRAHTKLTFDDITATPLTRADLDEDLAAVNSSVELIRDTRGGIWPKGQLTKDSDLLDLAWHEREFRDSSSFAYVVRGEDNHYIGCFYLYPPGHRTELSEALLDYSVDASWWVATSEYESYYDKLYRALGEWLKNDFPFDKVYYSNRQIPN